MTAIGDLFARDPLFADGDDVAETRDAVCECGATFKQRKLSQRFVNIVKRHSLTAFEALTRQSPDLFVPRNCPPCERADVAAWQRATEFNQDASLGDL
jgi:hypothetical protein